MNTVITSHARWEIKTILIIKIWTNSTRSLITHLANAITCSWSCRCGALQHQVHGETNHTEHRRTHKRQITLHFEVCLLPTRTDRSVLNIYSLKINKAKSQSREIDTSVLCTYTSTKLNSQEHSQGAVVLRVSLLWQWLIRDSSGDRLEHDCTRIPL